MGHDWGAGHADGLEDGRAGPVELGGVLQVPGAGAGRLLDLSKERMCFSIEHIKRRNQIHVFEAFISSDCLV